ncbi:hypothetical protein Rsub_07993 [Raphidocelis subcapitata]|uniref:Uncharacterized protein n=1 Tax=Raphidocelis subcapitata TaxID=307507 RepID=A0A2V0P4L2_9CHLO|nr:hypothetical protein Rsub_07993 [Raphidocelis subcapitata]|eukprot:GBF94821.1 hypothetical protein Rsub_07993 [Raphidocelis subcapitata]
MQHYSAALGIGASSQFASGALARRGRPLPRSTVSLTPWARPLQPRPIGVPVQHDQQQQNERDAQVCAAAAGEAAVGYTPASSYSPASYSPPAGGVMSEPARASLARATAAMRRYGWVAFWIQLVLSSVSGVILLFSVAFTTQTGPKAALYLTVLGILAGFFSSFWSYGYQRTSLRMQEYLDGAEVAKIKKQTVLETVARGILINVAGMGSALLGISSLVGTLVAKTLSNASVGAGVVAAAAEYNPVIGLDVFLVQAATNTLLGHFLALICSLWLLNVVGEGRGLKFQRQQHIQKMMDEEAANASGRGMAGSRFKMAG